MRLLALSLLAALAASPAAAQFAIGGQIGDPTGLSIKAGSGPGAVILAVGWDLDDSVSAEGHYLLRSRRVQGSDTNLALFYGPGLFINTRNDDANFGVSLGIGLEAAIAREIEIYGLVSPRLQLVDETDFDLGAGIGLRLRL